MRFLVQCVESASVSVEDKVVGKIQQGMLVFVGVSQEDTMAIADKMMDKMAKLRVFNDAEGKTNLSIADVGGAFLIVSQFTLYADCKKGNRPSFTNAGNPESANAIYEYIIQQMRAKGFVVEQGVFGAHMKVDLVNDGPFTVWLDSEEIVRK